MFERIHNLKIFEGIDPEVVDKIVLTCEERTYAAGAIILQEGDVSNGEGYILKSGTVAIGIKGVKIAELGEGDIFGEIALLNEEDRTATVKALTDISVIVLTYDNIIEMINSDNATISQTVMDRIEENLGKIILLDNL